MIDGMVIVSLVLVVNFDSKGSYLNQVKILATRFKDVKGLVTEVLIEAIASRGRGLGDLISNCSIKAVKVLHVRTNKVSLVEVGQEDQVVGATVQTLGIKSYGLDMKDR